MRLKAVVFALALTSVVAACGSSKSTATSTASPTGSGSATTTGGASKATVLVGNVSGLGAVLTNSAGRTLYMFDPENGGTIACLTGCTSTWMPVTVTGQPVAGSGVTGLGTKSRPDGATQVTYNKHPLYTYAGDSAAGQGNGDGVGGVWHAAKASAASGATATTASGSYSPY